MDRRSTVSHTCLHITEKENKHGWIITWREAILPKVIGFQRRPPYPIPQSTSRLFNLRLTSLLLPLTNSKVRVRSLCLPAVSLALPQICFARSVPSVTCLPSITRRQLAPNDIPLFWPLIGRSSSERKQEINSRGPLDSTGGVFKELARWTLPITNHKM